MGNGTFYSLGAKYLSHYGRKGMKWGKNIFDDGVDAANRYAISKLRPSESEMQRRAREAIEKSKSELAAANAAQSRYNQGVGSMVRTSESNAAVRVQNPINMHDVTPDVKRNAQGQTRVGHSPYTRTNSGSAMLRKNPGNYEWTNPTAAREHEKVALVKVPSHSGAPGHNYSLSEIEAKLKAVSPEGRAEQAKKEEADKKAALSERERVTDVQKSAARQASNMEASRIMTSLAAEKGKIRDELENSRIESEMQKNLAASYSTLASKIGKEAANKKATTEKSAYDKLGKRLARAYDLDDPEKIYDKMMNKLPSQSADTLRDTISKFKKLASTNPGFANALNYIFRKHRGTDFMTAMKEAMRTSSGRTYKTVVSGV